MAKGGKNIRVTQMPTKQSMFGPTASRGDMGSNFIAQAADAYVVGSGELGYYGPSPMHTQGNRALIIPVVSAGVNPTRTKR